MGDGLGLERAVVCEDGHVTDPAVGYRFESRDHPFDYSKQCRRVVQVTVSGRQAHDRLDGRCAKPVRPLLPEEQAAFKLGGEPAVAAMVER